MAEKKLNPHILSKEKTKRQLIVLAWGVILFIPIVGVGLSHQKHERKIVSLENIIESLENPTVPPSPSPSPTSTPTLSNKTVLSTIINEEYRFSFQYPSDSSVIPLGPNSAQLQANRGEVLSGTVARSPETYRFFRNNDVLFNIGIFTQNDTPLTIEGYKDPGYLYLYGRCDGRWLNTKPTPVKSFKVNGIDVLEVDVEGENHVSCYYFKNKDETLIVLSSDVFDNKEDLDMVEPLMQVVLSSIQVY